jgi:ABC-type multidrug transport system permease subunit
VLLGKTVTAALAILAVSVFGLLAARWIFGLHVSGFLPAALWGTFAGTMLYLLFMLLQFVAGSQRVGSILTIVLLFPLIMLGGSFFPFEAMPEWLAAIGRWTPNGWALVRFKEILWGASRAESLAVGAAGIAALGGILFLLNLARLRAIARG